MAASRLLELCAFGLACLFAGGALAKDSKPILPAYILNAHSVVVLVDPTAGVSLDDPNANQTARQDVENAMLKWGRFTTRLSTQVADLVIVVRKGRGKLVDETVPDARQNNRPGSMGSADNGINVGMQRGPQPPVQQTDTRNEPSQVEVGRVYDSFEVYAGNTEHPLDGLPGWKWVRKDGLHAHDVPAVDAFRKAIEDAEKKAKQQQGKHP
jgi:hypothetical protein